jgi:hypothetical protein
LLQVAVSQCDFGEANSLYAVLEGVIAAASPVNGTLLQGYDVGRDNQTMVGAAVVEIEKEMRYLFVAHDSGTIAKVIGNFA